MSGEKITHGRHPGSRSRSRILVVYAAAATVMSIFVVIGLEIIASAIYFAIVQSSLDQQRSDERHFYRSSANPVLVYELKPSYAYEGPERTLRINAFGMRGEEVQEERLAVRLGLLGDSVTFGIAFDQHRTISALLQEQLGKACEDIAVLNLGVPGYAAREIKESFRAISSKIKLDAAIYIMNLNDFSWRDSIYEGADNGLYRMYAPPAFKLLWFVRKVIYRWFKGGRLSTTLQPLPRWYRWMVDGTKDKTIDEIVEMKAIAESNKTALAVFILPAGVGYDGGKYTLSDVHYTVSSILDRQGLLVVDGEDVFVRHPAAFFDHTDHFTDLGNQVAANAISQLFLSRMSAVSRRAGCRTNG